MTATTAPHLRSTPTSKQLIVDGKPFFMRAAELQNSSLSSAEYMMTKWQKLLDMNINTILGSVTWEMIEPVEGQFDFTEIDQVITDARKFGMRLVLLWFGSFKNGQSSYVPSWVKLDTKRFPRVQLRKAGGVLETAEVLSLFDTEGAKADSKAFGTLMQHLREVDGDNHTVIMVQVENETGLLGDSRDGSSAANECFASPVPKDLVEFLVSEWESLHSDFRRNLPSLTSLQEINKQEKSWEDVFGRSPKTDELFMAYYYAHYLDTVASAGRKVYDLPLYTNVWMNYVDDDSDNAFPTVAGGGGNPGDYPSGGAVSNVLDVWQHFAPHLDFIAPDVYLTDYQRSCAKYRHRGQPLFIPEQRRDEYGARRIWAAIANYQAIGVSPFGIDTLEPETCSFRRHYGLLKQVEKVVLDAQTRPGSSVGFYFDELDESQSSRPVQVEKAGFNITIDRCFVFGKPGPGAGMIIHLSGEGKTAKFLLIGWGFHAAFKSANPKSHFTGILNFKEKRVVNEETGVLKTVRTLGGDETRSGIFAMMPNEDPDYGGFPIPVTIPAATAIAEVEVYSLQE